jgi:hypothetical protein
MTKAISEAIEKPIQYEKITLEEFQELMKKINYYSVGILPTPSLLIFSPLHIN